MGIDSWLTMLVVGAIAGWLAALVMRGGGFGLIGNIIVGIVGGFIAGLIFPVLGLSVGGSFLSAVVHSAIGAAILLFVVGLIRRD